MSTLTPPPTNLNLMNQRHYFCSFCKILTVSSSKIQEVYHQRFCVNRFVVFIGAGVLVGALKLRNAYT